MNTGHWLLCATALLSFPSASWGDARRLRVEAGSFDRPWTVVRFEPAPGMAPTGDFTTEEGLRVPYQIAEGGGGLLVLEGLKAGQGIELTPESGTVAGTDRWLRAKTQGEVCEVRTSAGRPVLRYQIGESPLPRPGIEEVFRRGGYIHPVFSPTGLRITDDYPANHVHHHGIWWAWTKTQFEGRTPDFWNMGQKKGRVEPEGRFRAWDGPVAAGFEAWHQHVDLTAPNPVVALREQWRVEVFTPPTSGDALHIFELTSNQECAGSEPLVLPEYHYGGLGVRGNWAWNGATETHFLTSGGETNRVKAHATRGRWCHIGGELEGKWTGMAILGHPENFRAPQPMRVHPTEPFFCFAPSQLGDWRIEPGTRRSFRYLFVVKDGPPDPELFDHLWRNYAEPVHVEWIH